jgi:hypothetical protein
MPVLRDFTILTGADGAFDREFSIGVGATDNVERRSLRLAFNTGGRHANGGALLMFCVKGLTRTEAHPEVSINGQRVGEIASYAPREEPEYPPNTHHWHTQTIAFDAGLLENGNGPDNTLEIASVPTLWHDREGLQEDFSVRSIVCFFPQRAGSDSWLEDVGSGIVSVVTAIGTFITGAVDVITTIFNAIIEVIESTVGWLIDALAFLVELTFSIPIIGRITKWLWNAVLTGFWAVAAGGLVDFLGAVVGILPEKKLRLCVIILRDENGDPVEDPANVVPWLQNTIDIFRREANVRVIPSAPFQFDSAFADGEVATEDWVLTQGRGSNDANVLDVECDGGMALADLGAAGGQFDLIASTTGFYSNGRRLIGYGAPVVVFIVRSVVGSQDGCSLGPLTDYVVVESGLGPGNNVMAHEIGHACSLWHVDDTTNLMNPDDAETQLSRFQVALLRSSRHVSYS